jgi:putative endonuclease
MRESTWAKNTVISSISWQASPYGTLYIGVTGNLAGRAYEHREDLMKGFTSKYGVHMLVWFEEHGDVNDAIVREKRLKKWQRAWKIELIEKMNPEWKDLFPEII